MYQKYYRQFLRGPDGESSNMLHMACHSHHYWPDVTLDAVQQYWLDAATIADQKWKLIFEEKIPAWQSAVARTLKLPAPERIAIAPNTHELVYRLLSAFSPRNSLRILTTDSEFYSFVRQLRRLEEEPNVQVTRIAAEPYTTLAQRFEEELQTGRYQVAYASQVFFDSGVVFPQLLEIAARKPEQTHFIIDGYHAFFARPTDLSSIADKVFYTAGSYKYLGAGEGLCFMTIPADCKLRPLNTGWFADLAEIEDHTHRVGYADNWLRFAGATMDYSTLYKGLAIFQQFERDQVSVENIHRYVLAAQKRFISTMDQKDHPLLNRNRLKYHDLKNGHGHFFTFDCGDSESAEKLQRELLSRKVLCDRRGQALRLGFAIYHPPEETYQRVFNLCQTGSGPA